MPPVGFKPWIPVPERQKTVQLYAAVTVMGIIFIRKAYCMTKATDMVT
jgi:hypothetical protein